jgi:hypothetical protein
MMLRYLLSELLAFPTMCLAYALAGFISKRIQPDGTLPAMLKWLSGLHLAGFLCPQKIHLI